MAVLYFQNFFGTYLKGDEFKGNALSNAVAQFVSHSTSKTITKMQKNQATVFERASPLKFIQLIAASWYISLLSSQQNITGSYGRYVQCAKAED